jgi:hypothetical protein
MKKGNKLSEKKSKIKYSVTSVARIRKDCQNVFELSEVRATEIP